MGMEISKHHDALRRRERSPRTNLVRLDDISHGNHVLSTEILNLISSDTERLRGTSKREDGWEDF